jgi:PAS domain S-box-containing protein
MWRAVLLALVVTALVVCLRLLLEPILGRDYGFMIFFPGIMLVSWVGGRCAGAVAVISATVSTWYFWVPVYRSFKFPDSHEGWHLVMFVAAAGLVVFFLGARRDNLMALRESEERFRAFFESALVGTALIDPTTKQFLAVNRTFAALTGYSMAELPGMTFVQITHPDDRPADLARFESLYEGRIRAVEAEKRYLRKDGGEVWVRLTTTILRDPGGRPTLQLSVVQDITASRESEHLLREAEQMLQQRVRERTAELHEKNAQLEAVCYTVAHDLRSPLRAITGYADFLAEELQAKGQHADYLNRIRQSAHRMDVLIHDLMTFTRVTQVDIALEPVSLSHCVERALRDLAADIRQTVARIEVAGELPPVRADRRMLENVVCHLVSNAIKFVPRGVAPAVKIDAVTEGDWVRLRVQDNGLGIAPQYHERIFKVFERLADAQEYPGTGIGLAIVARTIERFGGRAGVTSEVGQGSLFWIELRKSLP